MRYITFKIHTIHT